MATIEMNNQKQIERLVEKLNAKALSGGERHIQQKLPTMLEGIEQMCAVEEKRYRRMTTRRRVAVNVISCIVILLCAAYLTPHNEKYSFVFDDNLINHTETLNSINSFFSL